MLLESRKTILRYFQSIFIIIEASCQLSNMTSINFWMVVVGPSIIIGNDLGTNIFFHLQERVSKPARNPAPVTNPSKGHYLKKSPSPTGNKSPPGYPLSSNNGTVVNDESIGTDEYTQRKPLIAQVSKNINKRGVVLVWNFFNGECTF